MSDVGSFTLMLLEIGKLGNVALCASTIAFSINNLSFTPLMGISDATAIMTGQFIGKDRKDITEKIPYRSMRVALVYMAITGMVYIFFPTFLIDMFKPNETGNINFQEVAATGRIVLFLAAFWNLFDAMKYTTAGALRGTGDTRVLMYTNLFCAWVIGLSGMVIMVRVVGAGVAYVWGYMIFAIVAETTILIWRFQSGKWKSIDLTGTKKM